MPRPTAPRVDAAQRDAQALELRAAGASFREIAAQLGVSVSTAWKCVDRGLAVTRHEPSSKLRILERERLDRLTVAANQVLQARHVVVSGGKIVVDTDTGQPLVDHGPTLAAVNTLTRLMERRARLEGLDEPTRADISARVHAGVYSVDALDRELERVQQQLAQQDPEWGERERRQRQHEQAVDRFRADWSTSGKVVRDPARFVGDGLALLLEGLDLDDAQREAAALEVERLLWSGVDR
jgi:hypothetical protein